MNITLTLYGVGEPYLTDEEIAARVAEYAARPETQRRWADDRALIDSLDARPTADAAA